MPSAPAALTLLLLLASCGAGVRWDPQCAIHHPTACRIPLERCPPGAPPTLEEGQALIESALQQVGSMCTEAACPENTCCNDCGSPLVAIDEVGYCVVLTGTQLGTELGCGGDDSGLCCSLPADGTRLRLVGRLTPSTDIARSASAYAELEVERACVLSHPPKTHLRHPG